MKSKILLFLGMLCLTTTAFAHRLNEYLIATTVNLDGDGILLRLHLTPGEAVVGEVLKGIDQNGDHMISPQEQQAYVTRVLSDLSLTLDGRPVSLHPVSFSFPTVETIRKGTGEILVEFEVAPGQGFLSVADTSVHHFELKNNHYRQIAVYLVNCLLPADAAIHIDQQIRTVDQSNYKLEFSKRQTQLAGVGDQQEFLAASDRLAVLKTYFVKGVRHISTGYDHLLFLCALVLGAATLWDLIKIVTAFTIAHSLTLTLATFGLAHLSPVVVEPVIAASIVLIAAQNVISPDRTTGTGRLAAAFFFGLFHGLGFAGGLLDLMHAMPSHLIIYALFGFSLGVEAGNQLVLLPLYGLLKGAKHFRKKSPDRQKRFSLRQLASGVVALAGVYYFCVAVTTAV